VGSGIKEILDGMKIKQVSISDYLSKNFTQPVYCQIDVLDYNKRKDGKLLDKYDFYQNQTEYISDFERFTKVSDMYISGHFHANNAPDILTREMLNAPDCKIKIVADVTDFALYFSRSSIPNSANFKGNPMLFYPFLRHIGLYAYRRETLLQLTELEPTILEQIESLEQLRWLYYGFKIKLVETTIETPNIDVPEDVQKVLPFL
jgi:hypothetical protein